MAAGAVSMSRSGRSGGAVAATACSRVIAGGTASRSGGDGGRHNGDLAHHSRMDQAIFPVGVADVEPALERDDPAGLPPCLPADSWPSLPRTGTLITKRCHARARRSGPRYSRAWSPLVRPSNVSPFADNRSGVGHVMWIGYVVSTLAVNCSRGLLWLRGPPPTYGGAVAGARANVPSAGTIWEQRHRSAESAAL